MEKGKCFDERQTIKRSMFLDKAKAKGKGHGETSQETSGNPAFI